MTKWFSKYLRSSRETSTASERRPLLQNDHRQGTRSVESVSEVQRPEIERHEVRGPNLLTGEGTESQKLEAHAKEVGKRIKGTDVRKVLVSNLKWAFHRRLDRLSEWIDKDEDRFKQVLACDWKLFREDVQQLWELQEDSAENVLDTLNEERPKARATEFLKAVVDVLESWEWRLQHADGLENQGRLDRQSLEEACNALDANNCRAYFTVRNEFRQSIRAIDRMYKDAEGTYTPGLMEQVRDELIDDYNKGTNKFMLHFTRSTWCEKPNPDLRAQDIKKWRKAGLGLVEAERLIVEYGVAEFSSYGHKNRENGQGKTNEEQAASSEIAVVHQDTLQNDLQS